MRSAPCPALRCGLAAVAIAFAPAPAGAIVELRGEIFLGSQIRAIDLWESDTAPSGGIEDSISRLQGPGAVGEGEAGAAYAAEVGRLRARASIRVVAPDWLPPSLSLDSGTRGTASWRDTMTISAPGLAGTTGWFVPRISLLGSLPGDAAGEDPPFESWVASGALLTFDGGFPGSFQQRGRTLRDYAGEADQVVGDPFGTWVFEPVPFVFGTPFPLAVQLDAGIFARTVEGGATEAFVGLFDTAEWRGIAAVLDASESPVPVYTVTAGSGFDCAAPEPAAGALGGAATAALGALRHCRLRPRRPSRA